MSLENNFMGDGECQLSLIYLNFPLTFPDFLELPRINHLNGKID